MKKIPLTQGREALVDDCDYEYLMQWKWCASKEGSIFYAVSGCSSEGTLKRMHRVVAARMGFSSSSMADHINRNGLDNQRENLRPATKVENGRNRGPIENSKSGYKGVSWRADRARWRVNIRVNDKQVHLGYFDDKVEAAKAYNAAAKKHFGEFAWLNPTPGEKDNEIRLL
jgi:hypothetical protein